MSIIELYFLAALIILAYMTILWLTSLALKNSSIVDIFWGLGFVVANWVYYALTPDGSAAHKILISALVTVWGLRLSLHILVRNWRKPEDFRYRKWREESGDNWWWFSFFKVFVLQGMLLWIISAPLMATHYAKSPKSLTFIDIIAIILWTVGFFFESVGDYQLVRFKANPANKGQVLRNGVWRYTRHPNYFGDAAQWWGYYLISVSSGGWWTIFSPILMTTLLLRVSGVALLEKTLKDERPEYQDYMETTNAFIPWFPRKPSG